MSEWIRKLTDKYSGVNENKKAALLKKLAKTAQSSAKGKAAVTLPKAPFKIPEEIAATERTAFMGAAAAAHKSGKSHFNFAGKKHKVTMQKDTAKAIADDVKEAKLDELTAAEKKLVNQMYDKKGNLTPLGKKVMNHKAKPTAEAYENIPKATHKGVQDPMGKGLSPSAKDQLAKKMPTPEPIDEPKVDAKNFKTFRKGLKQAKKRPGDK